MVRSATAQVRRHGAAALFKVYILNNEEAFFGFYPVVERTVTVKSQPTAIYDVLGKDVPLFHFAASDETESLNSQYVHQSRTWFDSVWNTIARDHPL